MRSSIKHQLNIIGLFIYKKLLLTFLIFIFSHPLHSQQIDENYVNSINSFIRYMDKTTWGVSQNFFIFADPYNWINNGEKDPAKKFSRHSFANVSKSEYSDAQLYTKIYMLRHELDNSHKRLVQITDSVHIVYKQIINHANEIRNHILQRRYELDNFKHYHEIIDQTDKLYKSYHKLQQLFRKEIHKIAIKIFEDDKTNPNREQEIYMRNALDYQLKLLYKWAIYMNGGNFPYDEMKQNMEYTAEKFLTNEKNPDIDPHVRFHYKRFYSYLNYEHQKFKKGYLEHYDTNKVEGNPKLVIWRLISAFNIRCVREHNMYVKKASEIGIFMLNYNRQPYLFIKDPESIPVINTEEKDLVIKTEEEVLYESMDGYAVNHLILLLDVSASMNSDDKLPLLKKSFKRLLKILRKEDMVSIIVYSGTARLALKPTSCSEKEKITEILEKLRGGGSTNLKNGLELAYSTALNDFIREGNNRIILATDGQFTIDKSLFKQAKIYSKKNIHLSVFHFGSEHNYNKLEKLATSGKGNYEFIDKNNVALKLIKEAKAVKTND